MHETETGKLVLFAPEIKSHLGLSQILSCRAAGKAGI
jgi:hypothetical protein